MVNSQVEEWGEKYGLKRDRIYFLISGPSGSGKTVIIDRVLSEVDGLRKLVTTTTREKRINEIDGVNYYFISNPEFESMIKENKLVEWKSIFGNYYGLTCNELTKYSDYDIIFDMDVRGKNDFVRNASVDCVTIFLAPPSIESLRDRLKCRNDVTLESLEERLSRAKDEISFASEYDYFVENVLLNTALDQIKSIIFAERSNRDMQLMKKISAKLLSNLEC